MADPVNGRYKAFLFVGIAYFLTAVLAPLAVLFLNGASWHYPVPGMAWSLIAGISGAVGAFCVLLAFGAKGSPAVVMSIVFAGAPIVKFFPGPSGGPGAVKAIRGPLPFLRIFPTSGVTLENAAEYLQAGAFGLGFVACLFEPADLDAGRFDVVRQRAASMIEVVRGSA